MSKLTEFPKITDVQNDDRLIATDTSTNKDGYITVEDVVALASGAVTSVNGETGAVDLELNDLTGVDIPVPGDNEVLSFNSSSGNWESVNPSILSGDSEAGGTVFTNWLADLSGITPPPASGKVMWNNVTQVSSTKLYINYTTDTSVLLDSLMNSILTSGGEIFVYDATNVNTFQRWEITGFTDNTTYAEVDVSLLGGTAQFASDAPLKVALVPTSNKEDFVPQVE